MELGTERIRKLLVQYAVPAVVAMTASSLYNMVDSIFIGHGAVSYTHLDVYKRQRAKASRACEAERLYWMK